MFAALNEEMGREIHDLAERLGGGRRALMPILQHLQRRHRHVPGIAMQMIADELGIHPVEVHSVVSFYGFLDTAPKGRFVVRLCRTISCDMQGKAAVARQLESDLGIRFGETTPDGLFSLEWTNCIGMCDQGPALLVNDRVHTRVTPGMLSEILDECRRSFEATVTQPAQEAHP